MECYLFLNAAFCAEPEDLHLLLLPNAMGTVHSLHQKLSFRGRNFCQVDDGMLVPGGLDKVLQGRGRGGGGGRGGLREMTVMTTLDELLPRARMIWYTTRHDTTVPLCH